MPGPTDPAPWDLPIAGFEILEMWFSGQIYLIGYADSSGAGVNAPRMQTSLRGASVHHTADGRELHLDAAASWNTLTSLLGLRHARGADAVADRQGHLRLTFDNGSVISAGPDDRYENWGVSGPNRLNLAVPPGGSDPRISG